MNARRIRAILLAILAACEPSPLPQPAAATPAPATTPASAPAPAAPAVIVSPPRPATSPSNSRAPAPAPPNPDATPDTAPARGRVVVTTSDECGFILDSLYFQDGSAVVSAAQEPIIAGTAEMFICMQRTQEVTRWQVIGNADPRERDPVQMALDRAHAVEKALIAHGVLASSLEAVTLGASDPLDRRGTPAARAKNRRVSFLALTRGSR